MAWYLKGDTTAPFSITTPPAVLGTFRLLWGISALAAQVQGNLRQLGWEADDDAPVTLVIDGPWGFALQQSEWYARGDVVVVTDNPCPKYWEDISDLKPRALLAVGHGVHDTADALRRSCHGEFFRRTPQHERSLTYLERKLLRLCASSWENRRIAQELGITEGAVRNGLCRVFEKLGFENRMQAALYYWGLWHLLKATAGSFKCFNDGSFNI